MRQSLSPRVVGLYVLSIVLLTYYGVEVCPFLDSLRASEFMGVLAGAFALNWLVRAAVLEWLDRRVAADPARPWFYLLADLGSWLFTGLLVTLWNALYYEFPLESGLKVVLGCLTLGIFAASYLALEVEHEIIEGLAGGAAADAGPGLSITTKFLAFVTVSLLVVSGVLLLLIYQDFTYAVEALSQGRPFDFYLVAREILFVFAVLLAGAFMVARRYSRNLKLLFDHQLRAFAAVGRGEYDASVPVVSRDEFGEIARQTNRMIGDLRQKARIERSFGKYLSPSIAEGILHSEGEAHLGGREVEAAVLFTDLRDFTPLSESRAPRQVVEILNAYFTMVVDAVHRHNGVLDKFIGDAAMAVFGLDGCDAPEAAARAALEILDGVDGLNRRLGLAGGQGLRLGVGVHFGPVVAGNIGSEERLEYTVIGDTVNTAARLEGLTKGLPSPLALSAEVHAALQPETRARLRYLDAYALKGKRAAVPVYGLKPVAATAPDESPAATGLSRGRFRPVAAAN